MIELFSSLSKEQRANLQKRPMPEWLEPMLATRSDKRFSDPEWLYERKLDGERTLVFKEADTVRLYSRNRKTLEDTYPELADAFRKQPVGRCIMDGEIVAFSGNRTSFSRLQKRMQISDRKVAVNSRVAVYLYLFDVLYLEGQLITELSLRTRKKLLKQALDYADPLRFTPHRNERGEAYYAEACEKGWEGLIAKEASAPYRHARSTKWLKFKCVSRQELVIGGWTEPHGERRGFGALLVGYFDGDDFVYAGKVGTGYDEQTLDSLHNEMTGLERETSPFKCGAVQEKEVHYVTPGLVAEIGFTEWTQQGRLRHPRYLGLRRDKDAKDVVREPHEN